VPYLHRLKVRYNETDQMGVVHHANYLAYLEEARTEFMADRGCPYGRIEAAGVGLPVRRAELRYRAPAFYEDQLEIEVAIGRLRAASVTFEYRVLRPADGTLVLEGSIELACVTLAGERKPRLLPAELREGLTDGDQSAEPSPA
jgi:acyl-CoA thioester hydrolase